MYLQACQLAIYIVANAVAFVNLLKTKITTKKQVGLVVYLLS